MKVTLKTTGRFFMAAVFFFPLSFVNAAPADSDFLKPVNVTQQDYTDTALVRRLPGFTNHEAYVNGVKLHYVTGGKGEPLVLLGGWPETWWEYHKIMPELAAHYQVIAIDIRGQGGSSKPASGYDKKTMARDIYSLVNQLGYSHINIVGHDIGAMVAYSFAANYPDYTKRVALLDVPHPFEAFRKFPLLPQKNDYQINDPNHGLHFWWFAFNQVPDLPEKLLEGRTDILVDWVYDYLNKTPGAISSFDRSVYKLAAAQPDAIRAGNGWYQSMQQDIDDLKTYKKLQTPILGIGGISAPLLSAFLKEYARNYKFIEFKGAGHWIAEERPRETIKALLDFLK